MTASRQIRAAAERIVEGGYRSASIERALYEAIGYLVERAEGAADATGACDTCRWFKRDWERHETKSEFGQCIRHAPVTGILANVHVTLFPRVGQRDTCGEYAKENA